MSSYELKSWPAADKSDPTVSGSLIVTTVGGQMTNTRFVPRVMVTIRSE